MEWVPCITLGSNSRKTASKSKKPAVKRAAKSKKPAVGDDPTTKDRFEKEFDEEANKTNGLTKDQVSLLPTGSSQTVAWRCPIHDQTYEMMVRNWSCSGTKCTGCQAAKRAANSTKLAVGDDPTTQDRFEKEFDEEANKGKKLTKDQVSRLTTGSGEIVAWMCPIHGERYEMVLRKWTSGRTKCMGCRAAIKMLIV